MIGVSFAYLSSKKNVCIDYEKTEDFHNYEEIIRTNDSYLAYSQHDSYPIRLIPLDNYMVILEGSIYNMDEKQVVSHIVNDAIHKDYSNLGETISQCDGDFAIYIYDKGNKNFIVVNDCMGRLPIYYCIDGGNIYISRKLNFVLSNLSKIRIKKSSILEYLAFEYVHGADTLFEDVFKVDASSIIECVDGKISVKYLSKINFDDDSYIPDNKEIADEYINATKIRADYFDRKNIISTLSGGFDSRAVFGCLSKQTSNVDYITYQYFQDESPVACKLIQSQKPESRFHKLNIENVANIEDDELLFKTSGLINCYTNSICYNDLKAMYSIFPDRVLFGGFGGEFFRHPYYNTIRSVNYYINNIVNPFSSFDLFKNEQQADNDIINHVLGKYSENTKEGLLKHLYFEYYKNYVVGAGEERYRLYYWTVQPLMSRLSVELFTKLHSTKKSSFALFCRIIDTIDEKLSKIVIFGDNRELSETLYWKKKTLKLQLYPILIPLQRLYLNLFHKTNNNCEISWENIAAIISNNKLSNVFEESKLRSAFLKTNSIGKRRLYSLLRYFIVLENKIENVIFDE